MYHIKLQGVASVAAGSVGNTYKHKITRSLKTFILDLPVVILILVIQYLTFKTNNLIFVA